MSDRKSRKMMLITVFVIFIVLLSGCYLMPKEEKVLAPPLVEPPEIVYDTEEVIRDTVEKGITGTGSFIYTKKIDVFFKTTGGRIKEVHVELGDTVEEGTLLISLDTESVEYSISLQECSVRKAELYYDRIKKMQEENGGMEYELEVAEIDLEMARIQLDKLHDDYDKLFLYAPTSGVITYLDTGLMPGVFVYTNQIVMSLSDPASIMLEYTGEKSEFRSGMIIDIIYKGTTYEGEVVMTPYDNPTGISIGRSEVVLIRINDIEEVSLFRRGDIASVKLVLERSEDTLVIPKKALETFAGRTYVWILEDDIKKERDVETGLESGTIIEIKEGLEEGDLVIVD